jgi:2'-5' RNA ligase
MRCFVAVDFPEKINSEVEAAQSCIRGITGLSPAKWFHLTLKFLGEIDEKTAQAVKSALSSVHFAPFEASLSGIGFFPDAKNPRVIWIGLDSDGFYSLSSKIESALSEFKFAGEKFSAHITIARVKFIADKPALDSAISKINVEKKKFNVSSFSLKESTLTQKGPIYNTLSVFQLNL